MNKRQVIILWVIAIVLGAAVTAVKLSQNQTTHSATKRSPGQMLFESFPATEANSIEIQGANSTVTLVRKDGKWIVSQRDGYAANSTFVNDFIRTLGELKVTQSLEAGPSFAPRFGMDDAATKPESHGLTATFKDASGKEIAKVSLGKTIEGSAAPSPMGGSGSVGRYVRNHADTSGFYAVSEMFPSVSAEAKRWLNDAFISPEKIKSITVSLTGKPDSTWKLTRETEEGEYKLDGAAAAEVLDTTVASSLKSLFSYARFDDVVPTAQVADRTAADGKHSAVIETFEGFTYTVKISPAKPNAAAASSEEPAAKDNYLLSVDVSAEIPKERKKVDGEKPEDAKTQDAAFADRQKALTEKLAKEKAFAGITYEVAKTLVEPLLKDRAALIAKPAAPSDKASNSGGVQKLPGGMIARPPVTATTPPISVPPSEKK
jgi:hypothetical protein